MLRSVLLSLLAVPALAAAAIAQNPECAGFTTAGNARQTCDASVDFARAYYPLAGLAVSGGNPVIGAGGTAGRLGAVSVTIRGNGFSLSVPELGSVSAGGTVAQSRKLLAPAPQVEASVGLFPGLPGGLLSFDLLGTAQLIPNEKLVSDIRVDSTAPRIGPVSLGIGVGARVGVMAEGAGRPAVALSVMRRSLPRVGFGHVADGDEIQADVNLVAWNVRGTVGKRLGLLMLAGGAGWSRYSGQAEAAFHAGPGPGESGNVSLALKQDRWLAFADAGLSLGAVRLVGEIGTQFGVDQHLATVFEGFDDTAATLFYSAGLQFGF